jgi:hypothetical protein
MFQKNDKHLQSPLFSTLDELSSEIRERLEESWAGTFRREVFQRLDEKPFAVLYSPQYSRPNVPVNVLVSLETFKAGFGWTDEELYDHFLYDLQVRYALGYEQLTEGYFAIRTLYEFRRRLAEHMQQSGENLIEAAFEQVTDEQIQALGVRTSHLRLDSTQVASNIRQYSRIQLLVEVMQRVHRLLSEADQARYAEWFAPYIKGKSSHFVYTLKKEAYDVQLQAIGNVMAQMLKELAHSYAQTPAYAMLVRVFTDHFVWDETAKRPKLSTELAATSLQAPDDPEATFRRKQGENYRGFVTNLTETYHPDNDLQLILKVHTEPNVADDAHMLAQELPELIQRTQVEVLNTDGGYNSEPVDEILDKHGILHIQTAIRGDKPDAEGPSLVDFHLETSDTGVPLAATCPQGHHFVIEPGRVENRFIGRPDADICRACPLLTLCPVRPRSGNVTPALYVTKRDVRVALKRLAIAAMTGQANPRAAVEATVRSVKQPLQRGQLRVRGLFRVACQMIASALMVNVRRIQKNQVNRPATPIFVLLASLLTLWNCQQRRSPPVHPHFVSLACPEPDASRLPFGQFNSFSLHCSMTFPQGSH